MLKGFRNKKIRLKSLKNNKAELEFQSVIHGFYIFLLINLFIFFSMMFVHYTVLNRINSTCHNFSKSIADNSCLTPGIQKEFMSKFSDYKFFADEYNVTIVVRKYEKNSDSFNKNTLATLSTDGTANGVGTKIDPNTNIAVIAESKGDSLFGKLKKIYMLGGQQLVGIGESATS